MVRSGRPAQIKSACGRSRRFDMAQYGMCTNDYTTDFVKPVSFAFCVSGNALGRGEGF